jgi:hypothetical protein
MIFSNFHIEIKKKRTNNRRNSYFLMKRTLQCPHYDSLFVSLYVCVYIFVSRKRERKNGDIAKSFYNRIEDYYYTH